MEYMTVLNIVGVPHGARHRRPQPVRWWNGGARLTWSTAARSWPWWRYPGSGHIVMNWAHAHTTLMLSSLATLAMPVVSTLAAAAFLDQSVTGAAGASGSRWCWRCWPTWSWATAGIPA